MSHGAFTFQCSHTFGGIIRHFKENYSCAIYVVSQHALQLVASKVPAKAASCDKALRNWVLLLWVKFLWSSSTSIFFCLDLCQN